MRNIALLLSLALLLAGCGKHADGPDRPEAAGAPVPVKTALVRETQLALPYFAVGTVQARERAALSAKVSGVVAESRLQLGRAVRKNEVLVRLEGGEFAARVEQAKVEVSRLTRDYDRESLLLTKGASILQTVKDLEDGLRAANARLTEAQAMAAYLEVRAPFDGVVTADNVRAGDLAQPGAPLGELTAQRDLQVFFEVPASFAVPAVGTALPVEIDGKTVAGRLAEVSPAVDPRTRTRAAKLDLPENAAAFVGQFVRVKIPSPAETALLVPAGAVSRFGQVERVFVVQDGVARLRVVRTTADAPQGERIVASGLSAGETVVLNPDNLTDGQKVNP